MTKLKEMTNQKYLLLDKEHQSYILGPLECNETYTITLQVTFFIFVYFEKNHQLLLNPISILESNFFFFFFAVYLANGKLTFFIIICLT